jgi:hypothetical protein
VGAPQHIAGGRRLGPARGNQLRVAVGAADDQVGLAALAQAADHRDSLAVEGMLRRGNPNVLSLSARRLSSVMVGGR